MKSLVLILFSILPASLWLHCIAQDSTRAPNTISVKKKVVSDATSDTVTVAGVRFFNLYCKGEPDSLMEEFFPSKETALALCSAGDESQGEFAWYIMQDYEEFRNRFLNGLKRSIQSDKTQGIPLELMQVDSITFDPPNGTDWRLGPRWQIMKDTIYATDGKKNYRFFIDSFYMYQGEWYVLSTDYGFKNNP